MIKTLNIILILLVTLISVEYNSNNIKTKPMPIYDITINDIEGKGINLNDFKGKYVLFVNVASNCGFTRQYKDLQTLYDKYKDELVVVGVPCNQFGGQEPQDEKKIQEFCEKNYGVSFILTKKVDVKGSNQHPIYKWLTEKKLNGFSNSSVKWNFQKYFINKNGKLINYFLSTTSPISSKITSLIEQ